MSTTLTTEERWYRVGARYGLDGSLGFDAYPLVGRFKFHSPAAGATSLSFASSAYAVYGGDYAYNDPGFHFLVSAESTGYESQVGTGLGTAAAKTWNSAAEKYNLTGSVEVRLMPDTDYYLWIWPDSNLPSRIEPGTITVTLEGSYGSPSEFSVSDGVFGGQIPIRISPAAAGAVHDLTVSCAGRTVKLLDKSSAVSRVWKPALATYAPLLPNAGSAQASFTLETFFGGVSVGTRTAGVTVRFAEGSLAPALSAGWVSAAACNAGTPAAGLAVYVQGLSRAELSFDTSRIACQYGAGVASLSFRCGGVTGGAAPYRTGVLTGPAQIVCTVTDSRGQSASETLSVTPLAYAAPRLTEITAFRCDSQGTAAEDGTCCSVKARALYSDLGGHNSVTLTAALKPGGGSYGTETALQSETVSILGGLSPTGSYTVRLTATDALGSVAAACVSIPGEAWAMKFRPSGRGVAFGMAPDYDDCLQLPAGWKLRIGNSVTDEQAAYRAASIPMGACDGSSTATVFTATVPGITELRDGVCVWLRNGVVTSAAGFTLNVNGLGAKPVYGSLAAATRSTTLFNVNYTMLFIYNGSRVSGGCWDAVYGYDSNTNSVGYQLRRNNGTYTAKTAMSRYQVLLSCGPTQVLPVYAGSYTTGTGKTLTTEDFDPFGPIWYYSATAALAAGAEIPAASLWEQYAFDLRYAFNKGSALTSNRDVFLVAAPQANGRAKLHGDPIAQELPAAEDGLIYLYLGHAYSASSIVLAKEHPIYCRRNGGIQLWTGVQAEIDALRAQLNALGGA